MASPPEAITVHALLRERNVVQQLILDLKTFCNPLRKTGGRPARSDAGNLLAFC
jgi:hypothetical protein